MAIVYTADETLIISALREHSKSHANGKGGLSYEEISRACGGRAGSNAIVNSVSALMARRILTFADVEPTGLRLFYLRGGADV